MNGKKKKKPYFPNNWQEFKDADPEMFLPHTFSDLMDWKVAGWELPSSVHCIIRTTDLATKKVKEHVYKIPGCADNKIVELLNTKTHEFTVVTHDAVHHRGPKPQDDDD